MFARKKKRAHEREEGTRKHEDKRDDDKKKFEFWADSPSRGKGEAAAERPWKEMSDTHVCMQNVRTAADKTTLHYCIITVVQHHFVRPGSEIVRWGLIVGKLDYARHELPVQKHTLSLYLSPRGTTSIHLSVLTVLLMFLPKLQSNYSGSQWE